MGFFVMLSKAEVNQELLANMAQSSMLSSHSNRRDHNGLPVVVRKRKELLGFEVQNWNATHSTLCSVVESLGSSLDRIKFLENRVLHESVRASSPKAPAYSMKAIASINNSLVEDEIARLKDRDVLARQRFEEILGIIPLVVKYSLQDIIFICCQRSISPMSRTAVRNILTHKQNVGP